MVLILKCSYLIIFSAIKFIRVEKTCQIIHALPLFLGANVFSSLRLQKLRKTRRGHMNCKFWQSQNRKIRLANNISLHTLLF